MISLCSDNFFDEHLDKVMSEGGCYLVFHGACLLVILKAIIFFYLNLYYHFGSFFQHNQ